MNLSYREKSIAGSLAITVAIFGYYFSTLAAGSGEREINSDTLARLIFTVIVVVAVEIIYHIAISVRARPEPKDERNILIEAKSYRIAYFILAAGAFIAIGNIVAHHLAQDTGVQVLAPTPFSTVNVVLFFVVFSDIVKFATQLYYYSHGV